MSEHVRLILESKTFYVQSSHLLTCIS